MEDRRAGGGIGIGVGVEALFYLSVTGRASHPRGVHTVIESISVALVFVFPFPSLRLLELCPIFVDFVVSVQQSLMSRSLVFSSFRGAAFHYLTCTQIGYHTAGVSKNTRPNVRSMITAVSRQQ